MFEVKWKQFIYRNLQKWPFRFVRDKVGWEWGVLGVGWWENTHTLLKMEENKNVDHTGCSFPSVEPFKRYTQFSVIPIVIPVPIHFLPLYLWRPDIFWKFAGLGSTSFNWEKCNAQCLSWILLWLGRKTKNESPPGTHQQWWNGVSSSLS